MVSAACGAEDFYTIASHVTRSEGIDHARSLDGLTANVSVTAHILILRIFITR